MQMGKTLSKSHTFYKTKYWWSLSDLLGAVPDGAKSTHCVLTVLSTKGPPPKATWALVSTWMGDNPKVQVDAML